MENLSKYLKPRKVKLEQLLLDPNNPRFAELGDNIDLIPEKRFQEPKIQRETYEKMKSDKFDVSELRDTIKTIGFLQMDRIVAIKWNSPSNTDDKLVVIEGNRRITALKWLIELHESGKETFTDEQIQNFSEIEVLILDDTRSPEMAKWILPGLRHVSGIKEWGPYQKARAVFVLREAGNNAQEAAQSLGLSVRQANQLWRSYLGLDQMKKDSEFGEYAEPKMFSFFEEVLKKPVVRNWLEWSDTERKFVNSQRLSEFFSWVVGETGDDGQTVERKLPDALSIRDLGVILEDDAAMAIFRAKGGSLSRALAKFELEHPEDWRPVVQRADSVLTSLPTDRIRGLVEADIDLLKKLKMRIDRVIEDRQKLIS